MIIELTKRRYDQVLAVGDGLGRWLEEEATWTSPHRVDALMPAIGWEIVRSRLFEVCFTRGGARQSKTARSAYGALQMVTTAVAKREAHPAITGVGAFGRHEECISAWRLPDGGWRPYPMMSAVVDIEYTVLMPYREKTDVGPVTMWAPAPSLDHPSLAHPYFDRGESERLMTLPGSPSARALAGTRSAARPR